MQSGHQPFSEYDAYGRIVRRKPPFSRLWLRRPGVEILVSWKFVLYHCNYVALESFQQISLLCDHTQYILTPDRRKNSLVISLRMKVSYHSSSSSAAVCNQNHISREVLWLCNYCMLLLECISLLHIHWTVWQNHFQCCCTSITNASIIYIVLGPCWHDVDVVICIIVRVFGTKNIPQCCRLWCGNVRPRERFRRSV